MVPVDASMCCYLMLIAYMHMSPGQVPILHTASQCLDLTCHLACYAAACDTNTQRYTSRIASDGWLCIHWVQQPTQRRCNLLPAFVVSVGSTALAIVFRTENTCVDAVQ